MKATITIPQAPRPVDATRQALLQSWQWLDACEKLGWPLSVMTQLEGLWWAYHDNFGKMKDL